MTSDFHPIRIATALLLSLSACAGRTESPAAAAATPAASAPAAPAASPSAPAPDSAPASSPDWLAVDSAGKTVTLTLATSARSGASSALINEYRNGAARIVVPVGWTVNWDWRNADTTPHSLVVMVQREKIPLEGGRPALTNAMSRMVTEGLPPGQTDRTTFVAEEAGWYWLMCGVPSHALAGEWLELRVDPGATTAGLVLKKA
jgi:hypothetical protein